MILLNPSGEARLYDNVVCGPYVGMFIRERKQSAVIATSRDLVEVPSNAPMRPVITRDVAEQVLLALCGEGDPASRAPVWAEIWQNRDVLAAELAVALRKSERVIRQALRQKDPTARVPESPWSLAGYEAMGSFQAECGLLIADRCYVNRDETFLSVKTDCLAGTWHAFLRYEPNFAARTVSMLVVHENHFELAKQPGRELGVFGVDAGCAVIVDQRVRDDTLLMHALTETCAWDEGIIGDLGCFAYTYDGDGMYRVRAIEHAGDVVAVRANVSRDEAYDYHVPPPSEGYTKSLDEAIAAAGPAKPYAFTETFVLGDRVVHKKFGEGFVQRLVDTTKVEIAFPEGVKILVHGQKK